MGKRQRTLVGAVVALAFFVCPIIVSANGEETVQNSSISNISETNQSTQLDGTGTKIGQGSALEGQKSPVGATSQQSAQPGISQLPSSDKPSSQATDTSSASTVSAQGDGASCGDSGNWGGSSGQAYWSSSRNGADCVVTIGPGSIDGSAGAPWSINNPLHNEVSAIHFANTTGVVRLSGNIAGMFSSMTKLKEVRISNQANFDVRNAGGDFSQLFADCPNLQNIDLAVWKSAHPQKMTMMFHGDTSLTNLDLSGWNTSEATDMSAMFQGDGALQTVNVAGWDVSQVADMSDMFNGDSALTSIAGMDAWHAAKLVGMARMFCGDGALTHLNLSGFNTSLVKDMSKLFYLCRNLKTIDGLANWDTGQVELMPSMFSMVEQVPNLPLPGNPAYAQQVGPSNLSGIAHWNVSKVRGFSRMFMGLNSVSSLDLSAWKTSSAVSMQAMFAGCSTLNEVKGLGGTKWNTVHVNDMSYMFYLDEALTHLGDLSRWSTGNVQNMEGMFRYDEALSDVRGMSKWKTERVTSMAAMFQRNRARTDLKDVSMWKTPHVTLMWDMFGGDSNLKSLDVSGWDTSKVTSMTYMFQGTGITSLDLSSWDTTHVQATKDAAACSNGTVKADAGTCRVLPEYLNELSVGPKTKLTPEFFSGEPMNTKGYTGRWARDDDSWASDEGSDANEQLAERCPGTGTAGQKPQTYLWQQTAQISFDANLPLSDSKLSGGLPSAIQVTGAEVSKKPQTVPQSSMATQGYSFTGWNTVWNGGNDQNGKPGKAYKAGDKITLDRGEVVTLYAQWKSTGGAAGSEQPVDNEQYTVRYMANEPEGLKAGGTMNDDVFTANAAAMSAYKRALADNAYTVAGYTFRGWSRVPSSNTAWAPGVELNMKPGINIMYAQWVKQGAEVSGNGEGAVAGAGNSNGINVIMQPATILAGAPQFGASPTAVAGQTVPLAAGTGNTANGNALAGGTLQDHRDSLEKTPQEDQHSVPKCVERSTGRVRNSANGISYVTGVSTLPYCEGEDESQGATQSNTAITKTSTLPAWSWLVVLVVAAIAMGAIALRQRFASRAVATSQHRKGGK
ncbi:BspA family leucine-rich repeat surface protein [Bifidobacterium sp. ESL0764]|uniref:BspA family leucine-rich repeat surface protein n=1 Tax=Bifidobacterium sp. ESL0764 TaxID=2983228 RepID=UPI0023FA2225|nr:BspA family leucine-rich repeat surface protein [Bifidobacterium sp. ESL0764]WEV65421.1 BspA family leucine-rich repeat surface protein [Bifidobacterium sp. ESL0764]